MYVDIVVEEFKNNIKRSSLNESNNNYQPRDLNGHF
jgi:hypothetical protein